MYPYKEIGAILDDITETEDERNIAMARILDALYLHDREKYAVGYNAGYRRGYEESVAIFIEDKKRKDAEVLEGQLALDI